jgi:hypothetical protein
MKIKILIISLLLIHLKSSFAQTQNNVLMYENAYYELDSMLSGKKDLDFKRAVFITENAYLDNNLSYKKYNDLLSFYVEIIKAYMVTNELIYKGEDYDNVAKNSAIFSFMTDTTWLTKELPVHLPYTYDFEDIYGDSDWSSMFVSKLLETEKGNCHSMPFLYKILAEELGADAYLSLAPNHMYIKCRSERTGWYNVELTSAMFPIDAWISASGFVLLESIQNGIFMDTLGLKQSIAYCLFDLAKSCEKKFGFSSYPFIFDCLELTLEHYPNFINALIYKADCLKKRFDINMKLYDAENYTDIMHLETPKEIYTEMEELYVKIMELGYREMPQEMYNDWLFTLKENRDKYNNPKILFNFKQN